MILLLWKLFICFYVNAALGPLWCPVRALSTARLPRKHLHLCAVGMCNQLVLVTHTFNFGYMNVLICYHCRLQVSFLLVPSIPINVLYTKLMQ